MVLASSPVASLMRLAARPVGAHSSMSFSSFKRLMMQRMMVVLPVPGPPVTTSTPSSTALLMARFCSALKRTPSSRSYCAMRRSSPATRL